jgi:oligopeptide/dipeptide ABC transporter ATP-binding protein
LEVKHLRTTFFTQEGEVKAVNDLSYYVNKGESVAVVGESACGKSVSALSIMRLIPYPPGIIIGGEVIFKGKDLLKLNEEEMRSVRGNQIAMIFQEPSTSLNPVLTVSMQLRETLELHRGLDKQAAEEEATKLLKLVGIPDADKRVHDYPYQFSGGMQQRIMIAMGLSCNPELIIADEPTTSLDVTVQAQLLELIDNLRAQFGTAIILITHNLGIVARYVDRVNVMYAGKMVETGKTDDIYESPKHPYTIGLIGSVPRLDLPRKRQLYVIDGLPPHLARLPSGCSFSPRCRFAIDRCREEVPPLFDMGPDHMAACFRSNEMAELLKKERVA